MTPGDLAHLHARAMCVPAPWSADQFAGLMETPGVFLVASPYASNSEYAREDVRGQAVPLSSATPEAAQSLGGFALGRVILDEAELLTLAVDPLRQRQGIGREILAGFETEASERGARTAFLEVAANNERARGLYTSSGWQETGRREGYYRAAEDRVDAILMQKPLRDA